MTKGPHQSRAYARASFSRGEATVVPSPLGKGDHRAAMVDEVFLGFVYIVPKRLTP
jgi:hypothetical protein